jgi:hypothetical protein
MTICVCIVFLQKNGGDIINLPTTDDQTTRNQDLLMRVDKVTYFMVQ